MLDFKKLRGKVGFIVESKEHFLILTELLESQGEPVYWRQRYPDIEAGYAVFSGYEVMIWGQSGASWCGGRRPGRATPHKFIKTSDFIKE